MEQLRTSRLDVGTRLDRALYHSSGEVLLEPGTVLSRETASLLEQSGIEEVLRPEPGEDVARFLLTARNQVLPVSSLKIGQRVDRPIFDRSGALLVEAGTVVTDRLSTGLLRRGVDSIYVRRSPEELAIEQVQAFRQSMGSTGGSRPAAIAEQIDRERFIKPEECTARKLDELLGTPGGTTIQRSVNPLLDAIHSHDLKQSRPQAAKDGMMAMYDEAVVGTTEIFEALCGNNRVEEAQVGRVARSVVGSLIEERDLLLNLNNVRTDRGYLQTHSLAVTILSIAVSAARGHDRGTVLEMAYAAYLHDIGMLRMPKEILEKPGRLDPNELLQVRRHPIHSLDMLQRLVGRRTGVPTLVPIVAYQSHERDNGSGYPKGRGGRLIHEFAKIVGICDVYQALTSRRPWREALLPYQAMEQIVLMGARREMDPDIVRSMLGCVSLFPIGSWVELSDGAQARVVGLASSNYAKPVLSIVGRKGERLPSPERLDLAEHWDVQVVRPVPAPQELVDAMEGF